MILEMISVISNFRYILFRKVELAQGLLFNIVHGKKTVNRSDLVALLMEEKTV